MTETVRFVLDNQVVSVKDADPTRTVLQFLREDLQRCGSKEGCAEGDCGACTVVLAELNNKQDKLSYKAINSCIQFLPTLDGKALLTVESLSQNDQALHPVQQAMLECHGSQCGFCTPGFVMSLYAMYQTQQHADRRDVDIALAGNLCRCTGYRPIVDAALKMYQYDIKAKPETDLNETKVMGLPRSLIRDQGLHIQHHGRQFYAPTCLDELASLIEQNPDACILAGGTDVGLWVTKQYRDLETVIYLGKVAELHDITQSDEYLVIGAAATLSDAMKAIVEHYPEIEDLFLRFASPPIRNAGTLGGNIANGSPIGDAMPLLITLGTRLLLRCGEQSRELLLEDYYLDYQKTAKRPGEFVERILMPLPVAGQCVRSYKLSKRFDQDISAVCGAYSLKLDQQQVTEIKIAYGGLAAIPKRARHCESVMMGEIWNEQTIQAGMMALSEDYNPISDMRASRNYREITMRNLLYRFYLESIGDQQETDVYHYGR